MSHILDHASDLRLRATQDVNASVILVVDINADNNLSVRLRVNQVTATMILELSISLVDVLCSQFGCPSVEVGGEAGDVGVSESVGVVVLGVLLASGSEVGGELFDGDDGPQVVAQGCKQAGRCPGGLAEQGVDVEVVTGGSAVVEGSGFRCGGVGQIDDGAEAGDDDGRVLPVVLSKVEHDLFAGGRVVDDDLA